MPRPAHGVSSRASVTMRMPGGREKAADLERAREPHRGARGSARRRVAGLESPAPEATYVVWVGKAKPLPARSTTFMRAKQFSWAGRRRPNRDEDIREDLDVERVGIQPEETDARGRGFDPGSTASRARHPSRTACIREDLVSKVRPIVAGTGLVARLSSSIRTPSSSRSDRNHGPFDRADPRRVQRHVLHRACTVPTVTKSPTRTILSPRTTTPPEICSRLFCAANARRDRRARARRASS